MRRVSGALLSLCFLLPAGAGAEAVAGPHTVWGYWYTPDHDSLVRIKDCGDGTPCGIVTWVDPVRGKVTVDEHNKDEALRGRPIEGITLLHGFEAGSEDWRGGAIYHPGNGNTYRARIRRVDEDTLEVKGCLGPICKGQLWDRAAPMALDDGAD
ncbi:DUF2147 domain-containing protein [Parvularcula dongshanensis]|uniref:Uncharacterized protein (DUF2147 family) n=1 Tax=Parvularcula dongshanensis TaxID=1173995 RepID=A0A840I0U6_9PROT|nr:DUF2147 domain-containing protein [Parvularcula dongshanensis]MBB4658686.1 uncharacterized protein (DUF2147 family) [Parvularcula dongshanensis]